jgi:hypothetical protein
MGTRYWIDVMCVGCGHVDKGVYFAPTCDFTTHDCTKCGKKIDLEEYTGITREQASTRKEMAELMNAIQSGAPQEVVDDIIRRVEEK